MSKNDPFTKDGDARFTLRIPEVILNIIKKEAIKNKRSTGKEIEFILEEWLKNNHEE